MRNDEAARQGRPDNSNNIPPHTIAQRDDMLGVVVEGATDRFFGRPIAMNPYCPVAAADAWRIWQFGWVEADWFIAIRGQEEASRWLREAA